MKVYDVMISISDSGGNINLKLLTSQFWLLHHLCLGNFERYKFHLEDYQSRAVLSKEQKQEIHVIVDEHLKEAILQLSKLENKSYHPLLKLPEERISAYSEFSPPPGKPKREPVPPISTEVIKERKIESRLVGNGGVQRYYRAGENTLEPIP